MYNFSAGENYRFCISLQLFCKMNRVYKFLLKISKIKSFIHLFNCKVPSIILNLLHCINLKHFLILDGLFKFYFRFGCFALSLNEKAYPGLITYHKPNIQYPY